MTTPTAHGRHLSDAAHAYADAGWPVFPLRPGSKLPAVPGHPETRCDRSDPRCAEAGHVGWEGRATTDQQRVAKAWGRREWGIGIACGPAGLVVVDLDVAKDDQPSGAVTLRRLEASAGATLPGTWTTATPSGGRHLYYQAPSGRRFANTAGRAGPGIDTRAAGGYVAAPPTCIADGTYDVIDDQAPVELPAWFVDLLSPASLPAETVEPPPLLLQACDAEDPRVAGHVAAAVEGELTRVAAAGQGQRNHTLFTASAAIGQLIGAGLYSETCATEALTRAAAVHIGINRFTETEARRTIASGLSTGQQQPRRLPVDLVTATTGGRQ